MANTTVGLELQNRGIRRIKILGQQKLLIFAGTVLLLLTFGSFSAKMWWPADPAAQGDLILERYQAPSSLHPFGTDKFGRDILSRVLSGGRVSLSIALGVVVLS
ncbi:MAG: hypothetical protein WAN36_13150, partial [Calditrichia bacterium]